MGEAVRDYLAGIAAGVATVAVGHPFDTVKVKLQTQTLSASAADRSFRSGWHCSRHILRTEGVPGLYKGATASFIGVALESALLFGAYTQVKTALQGGKRLGGPPDLPAVWAAAAVGGSTVSLVLCPTELVKCRLQVQAKSVAVRGPTPLYDGPWDCVVKTVRKDGVAGLFRGAAPTWCREAIGNVVFFTVYEVTKFHLRQALRLDTAAPPPLLPAATASCREPRRLERPASSSLDVTSGGSGWAATGLPLEVSTVDSGAQRQQQPLATGPLVDSSGSTIGNLRAVLLDGITGVVSGGLAGIGFWIVVLPFDVIKSRIQTAVHPGASSRLLHNFRMLYQEAGIRGLYAGLGPTLVRAFPANAAAVVTWELAARMMGLAAPAAS
eukprot:SM000086S23007  [mRNA]  locus=s86:291:4012:+ [translate_table: standard]